MMCRFRQIIDVVIVNSQSDRMWNPAVVTRFSRHICALRTLCGISKEVLYIYIYIYKHTHTHTHTHVYICGSGSVVDIETGYGLDGPGIESR